MLKGFQNIIFALHLLIFFTDLKRSQLFDGFDFSLEATLTLGFLTPFEFSLEFPAASMSLGTADFCDFAFSADSSILMAGLATSFAAVDKDEIIIIISNYNSDTWYIIQCDTTPLLSVQYNTKTKLQNSNHTKSPKSLSLLVLFFLLVLAPSCSLAELVPFALSIGWPFVFCELITSILAFSVFFRLAVGPVILIFIDLDAHTHHIKHVISTSYHLL